jgi:hypothetical protein
MIHAQYTELFIILKNICLFCDNIVNPKCQVTCQRPTVIYLAYCCYMTEQNNI